MPSSFERSEESSLAFGGQAVLEGVMIRSRRHAVTCVRRHNGEIVTLTTDISPLSEKYRVLQLPFIRGIPSLVETLILGFKSLFLSANVVLEDEGETLTYKEFGFTAVMSLAIASFFLILPFLLTNLLLLTGMMFNLVEAVIRLSTFLIFLKLVSLWSQYKRVLQYHGAEHKVINTYEAREPLTLVHVKKNSRLHPRCGTSFIFITVLVSILLLSIIPNRTLFERLAYRVFLLPVIGALSYEILRFSGKRRNVPIMKLMMMPGLAIQHLTTKEPDNDMLEVAIKAVSQVNKLRQDSLNARAISM